MTKLEIAQKLKAARIKAGLTQVKAGDAIGKSYKLVGHWETGYSQPDADTLASLLKLYNVDANDFFEINKAPAEQQEQSGGGNISLEDSNRLLVALGFIHEGEQLSDNDLAFLANIIGLLDNWFSGKNR